jgi:hypothetical protein
MMHCSEADAAWRGRAGALHRKVASIPSRHCNNSLILNKNGDKKRCDEKVAPHELTQIHDLTGILGVEELVILFRGKC